MKNKICIIFAILLLLTTLPAKAVDMKEKLSQIGFNIIFEKDPKTEITKVIEKQQDYANNKNYKQLVTLYTTDYTNFDGITLDDYIESIKSTWLTNEKLQYKTVINSININGNYATVEVTDTVEGTTKEPYENVKGKGSLNSIAKSRYYLKKVSGEWKISSEMILSEKTTLLYGSTKNIPIKISAPECVYSGSQYDVSVEIKTPEKSAAIVSIVSEKIQYPQTKSEDAFRSMKQTGEIERTLTANTNGKNEVAFVSLAIAKAVTSEDNQVTIAVDGVAFIASRVNVLPNKAKINE